MSVLSDSYSTYFMLKCQSIYLDSHNVEDLCLIRHWYLATLISGGLFTDGRSGEMKHSSIWDFDDWEYHIIKVYILYFGIWNVGLTEVKIINRNI